MTAEYITQDHTLVRVTYDDGSVKYVPVDVNNSDYAAMVASGVTIGPFTGTGLP